MKFCPNCGKIVPDNARFCPECGTLQPGAAASAPTPPPAPQPTAPRPPAPPASAQPHTPQPPMQPPAPQAPAQAFPQFAGIPVRYHCPNGHVFDGDETQPACPKCGAPLPKGGYIQLYRMGNYMGGAVGMGIYIDDVPCGHIGNRQSLRISVPFGSHKVHLTHTTTRKCNDPIVTVTPEAPYFFGKAHFTKAGFAIAVEPAAPQDMPTR